MQFQPTSRAVALRDHNKVRLALAAQRERMGAAFGEFAAGDYLRQRWNRTGYFG
jgi:hypothetical protein